jgi:hypothetical protein
VYVTNFTDFVPEFEKGRKIFKEIRRPGQGGITRK